MDARVSSKARFYALWQKGLLGNRPRTWTSVEALAASGYRGTVSMRTVGEAGGKTRYRVPVEEAIRDAWPGVTFNESAPDDLLTLQGEVMRGVGGLDLYYDTTPNTKMNEARLRFRRATGVAAKVILDSYLWPSSRDDLDALLDLYEDAVVEFSAYTCKVGDQNYRNTLFWEVRSY